MAAGLTRETFLALSHTCLALTDCTGYLLHRHRRALTYVLLRHLQSDAIERRFGWLRQLSGASFFHRWDKYWRVQGTVHSRVFRSFVYQQKLMQPSGIRWKIKTQSTTFSQRALLAVFIVWTVEVQHSFVRFNSLDSYKALISFAWTDGTNIQQAVMNMPLLKGFALSPRHRVPHYKNTVATTV